MRSTKIFNNQYEVEKQRIKVMINSTKTKSIKIKNLPNLSQQIFDSKQSKMSFLLQS